MHFSTFIPVVVVRGRGGNPREIRGHGGGFANFVR